MKRGGLAGTLTALALMAAPVGAPGAVGDVYVADQSAGPGGSGAIFRVDLATGAATPVSVGSPLENPADMVFGPDGQLIVTDDVAAAIYRVDPATGIATEVARGGELADPWGLAYGPAGRLFVADVGFEDPAAVIFRINAGGNAGAKVQHATGPPLVDPVGIAREGEDSFLVTDLNGIVAAGDGIIHRVDANVRGAPVVQVAAGPPLVDPWGISV